MRETALLVGLLFFGFILMPIGIFLVGNSVFGEYGGNGYWDFFSGLSGRIRNGDGAAWFLVLSPYLGVLLLRLMLVAWRATGKSRPTGVSSRSDEFGEV